MRISPIVADVQAGTKTAREYVEEAIARARSDSHNAVLSIIETRALARADEVDAAVARGEKTGLLAGVPFLAKDNILAFGAPTTAATYMLESFDAPYQSTAIERLEEAGAICIGKTNLDAFAHGGSTENSYFGPTTNPHDTAKVPGGSSGGSAAAVALGIVPFALGTDTGGSIRQPASFCGVVGLKPTYGAVSRYGVVAMASSTDVVGPIASNVDDTSLVFSVMSGADVRDATTLPDYFEFNSDDSPVTVGVIEECLSDDVNPAVKESIEQAIIALESAGHAVRRVSMPSIKHALAVYYIVVPAEIASNLARYDGIRYGHRSSHATTLDETVKMSRSEGFMDENKRRILIGNYVLSSGYYDAYYHKAQSVRTIIINEFNDVFKTCDVLLAPVAPTPAFGLGQNTHDPLSMYLADIMTVPASLAGIPALSVPFGVNEKNMPIGVQLMAAQRQDAIALRIASVLEKKVRQ